MTLPRYILRRFVEPGGTRLPKLKPFVRVAGICPGCSKAVLFKKMMGVEQMDGLWYNSEVYHYGCRAGGYSVHNPARGKRKVKVLKGNLRDEEYRYWIGSQEEGVAFAMCRCCRTSVYSQQARDLHFRDAEFQIDGEQCTTRLVNAYKKLEELAICLVCKKHRFNHKKWGVPLCDDPHCEMEWKFNQQRWLPLEARLHKMRKMSIIEANPEVKPVNYVDAAKGLVKLPSDRPWCNICCMYADVAGHEDEHAKRLMEGMGIQYD